uniref:Guanylate cyclase domain-containing protein n=2 Tax=Chrysotila carterae TaxID=13221 RepID=A0A7S4ETB3_CHRCT
MGSGISTSCAKRGVQVQDESTCGPLDLMEMQQQIEALKLEVRELREGREWSKGDGARSRVSDSSASERRTNGRSKKESVSVTSGEQAHSITYEVDYEANFRRQVYALSQDLGQMQRNLSLDDLRHLLGQWRMAQSDADQLSLATAIRRLYVRDYSLLVSDMSGFTRITKEDGICHFLMLIKRMQTTCIPLMQSFGGTLVKVEADNLFVIFPTPRHALMASMHCHAAMKVYNAGKRPNDSIHLSMSIVHGSMFHIPGVDVFGGVVPIGFELGEDAAGKDETLVVEDVVNHCKRQPGISELVEFVEADPLIEHGQPVPVWRALMRLHKVTPRLGSADAPIVNTQVNAEEPVEFVTMMEERMSFPSKMAEIDSDLQGLFTEHSAVLVITLHFTEKHDESANEKDLYLLDAVLSLKAEAARICKMHLGAPVTALQIRASPVIFALFPDCAAAFNTAIEFASFCHSEQYGVGEFSKCSPSMGITQGRVLNLNHHNAFGDAVNCAFKLGEDIAQPWHMLIDEAVVNDLINNKDNNGDPLSRWPLVPDTECVSGVVFIFSRIDLKTSMNDAKFSRQESELPQDQGLDLRRRRASDGETGKHANIASLVFKAVTTAPIDTRWTRTKLAIQASSGSKRFEESGAKDA